MIYNLFNLVIEYFYPKNNTVIEDVESPLVIKEDVEKEYFVEGNSYNLNEKDCQVYDVLLNIFKR